MRTSRKDAKAQREEEGTNDKKQISNHHCDLDCEICLLLAFLQLDHLSIVNYSCNSCY